MKKITFVYLLLTLAALLMTACQAIPARVGNTNASSNTAAPVQVDPSPTPNATAVVPTIDTPTAQIQPTEDPAARVEKEVTQAAEAYFTAVSAGDTETAADLLSGFSLMVFQITRGDAANMLQAQKIAGIGWTDLEILDVQPFDDQTMLVHVIYAETGREAVTAQEGAAPTSAPAQTGLVETVEALWPMRLEQGAWRYNWNNLIDFRTLDGSAQTMNGITIMPVQVKRYTDKIQLSMLVQNRTNEAAVFGQVNETLGTFYFSDRPVVAEKTQWILNPLRSVPEASLEIKGLFPNYPDTVEIRRWNNYDVEPWYVFQLK